MFEADPKDAQICRWCGATLWKHSRMVCPDAPNPQGPNQIDPMHQHTAPQHNHVTRDVKDRGKCPACDETWASMTAPGEQVQFLGAPRTVQPPSRYVTEAKARIRRQIDAAGAADALHNRETRTLEGTTPTHVVADEADTFAAEDAAARVENATRTYESASGLLRVSQYRPNVLLVTRVRETGIERMRLSHADARALVALLADALRST